MAGLTGGQLGLQQLDTLQREETQADWGGLALAQVDGQPAVGTGDAGLGVAGGDTLNLVGPEQIVFCPS